MSALDNNPKSLNFLSPLNFNFRLKRAPNLNFFIQKVNLPAISFPSAAETNPFVNIPIAGDHLQYGDLSVTFKVDEDLNNYLEMHNWIRALTFPDNFDEYKAISKNPEYTGTGLTSDITLIIANSVKIPNYEVNFRNAYPTSLSALSFQTTDSTVEFITATVTFKYTMYDIVKI